jgi:hypothetical protein
MTKRNLILASAFALIALAIAPAFAQADKDAIDEYAKYLDKRADLEARVRGLQVDLWALRAEGADQAKLSEKAADLQEVLGKMGDLDQANAGLGQQLGAVGVTPCPFGYAPGTGRALGRGVGTCVGMGPGAGFGGGQGWQGRLGLVQDPDLRARIADLHNEIRAKQLALRSAQLAGQETAGLADEIQALRTELSKVSTEAGICYGTGPGATGVQALPGAGMAYGVAGGRGAGMGRGPCGMGRGGQGYGRGGGQGYGRGAGMGRGGGPGYGRGGGMGRGMGGACPWAAPQTPQPAPQSR